MVLVFWVSVPIGIQNGDIFSIDDRRFFKRSVFARRVVREILGD